MVIKALRSLFLKSICLMLLKKEKIDGEELKALMAEGE